MCDAVNNSNYGHRVSTVACSTCQSVTHKMTDTVCADNQIWLLCRNIIVNSFML